MKAVFIVFFFSAITFASATTFASSPPVPESKAKRLRQIEEDIKKGNEQKKELERDVKGMETELRQTKNKLVTVSRKLQEGEKELYQIEMKIDDLQIRQVKLEEELKDDRLSISRLILALGRIRRVPPEAMIAKPDVPYKTAQSALLMKNIIPALHKQAASLSAKLNELNIINKALQREKEKVNKTLTTIKKEEQELQQLLARREELYKKTRGDFEAQARNLESLSRQAQTLQQLLAEIEEDQKRQRARQASKKAVLSMPQLTIPRFGGQEAQLPLSGIIKIHYNEPDAFGAPSQGLTIEGRPSSLIVSPMDGIIRFTGTFKNYGRIIIIEHENNFHSLIAGFEKIDTVVGRKVMSGEPLGRLEEPGGGTRPRLYFELRHNGKPINPAEKLSGLS